MIIITVLFIFILINVIIGMLCINMLDRKTRHKDDESIGLSNSYTLLFLFFNIFCLLFINKIREKRKIEHIKIRLELYNSWPYKYLNNEEKSDISKMKRYLKLKKIPRKYV